MENQNNFQNDEEVIDLKELMLYLLRKWRVLILAGCIGLALGIVVGLLMPEKTIDDLDMDKLHIKEIGQYARYQQLYDEQLEIEAASVYMNMDPSNVHSAQKVYFVTAYEADMNRIQEGFSAILRDTNFYNDLVQASGLNCTEREIQELAGMWFTRYEKSEFDPLFGELTRSGKVTISIKSPSDEACEGMMDYLDARVFEQCETFADVLEGFTFEVISDTCNVGYDAGVVNKRTASAELLASYVDTMTTLKKNLTDDDLLYYRETYNAEELEEESGLGWLKWGIVIGVLFGGLLVVFYGVKFLLDNRIKNTDELKQREGLHLIATLESAKKKKANCIIDKMLEDKYEFNSDAYLCSAIKASGAERLQLSGDLENPAIAEKMNLLAEDKKIVICNRFAVDEHAAGLACETDGAILFVQLWKTKHKDLQRELEICRHIGQKVIGVVVIDG